MADSHPLFKDMPAPSPEETPAPTAANGNGRKRNGGNGKKGYEPHNLAKAIRLPVPDFADPHRKATCLEVDFPIAPINALAKVEVSSGPARKRVYCMSKWWARRASSVFRSILIGAATESPDDRENAAKRTWDHYYCNHQKAGSFKRLTVLDPFMGGGTTLVEGARLGFQLTGVDLNPVAWFVTKNELACSDPKQVKALFDHIEADVKPQIQPFYTTTCPRGHRGRWIDLRTDKEAPDGVDPIDLSPEERKHYRWEGPEVIYTFWSKHGPCAGSQGQPCGHRTPIFGSLVIAEKKLTAYFIPIICPNCGSSFRTELGETRMAPGAERVVADTEPPFTELTQGFGQKLNDYSKGRVAEKRDRVQQLLDCVEDESGLRCPHCATFAGQEIRRVLDRHNRPSTRASDIKKKDFGIESCHVYMYLLIHPKWLEGAPGKDDAGSEFGGWAGAPVQATAAWWKRRLDGLALIEVRGRVKLSEDESGGLSEEEFGAEAGNEGPDEEAEEGGDDSADRKKYGPPATITLRDGTVINTRQGTVPAKSHFRCDADGIEQDILEAVKNTACTPPVAVYALQCFCPACKEDGYTYGGRYFKQPDKYDISRLLSADKEWKARKDNDLADYWPKSPLWPAYMTHKLNGGIPHWGYTHWWKMFNSRQLLVHSHLLRSMAQASSENWPLDVREQALGAWQEFSRHQSMFCFWDIQQDCLAPMLANANYHPKTRVVENNLWLSIGRANWASCIDGVKTGVQWVATPTELALNPDSTGPRTIKVLTQDPLPAGTATILASTASDLSRYESGSFDLAITDPPFGNNLFYGDLADFFYVWMRLVLLKWYEGLPERAYFEPERTPRAIEAVQNSIEHPDDRDEWEREPIIPEKYLSTIRQHAGDDLLQAGEGNPLYRREPASQFYCDTLTACWTESARLLKPGGLMAFTFHHSNDSPWVDVLEALFNAGFVLVATYPIRGDETKGDAANAAFGSKKIEHDIIHVCRKRLEAPETVAWAKMRRWVKEEGARYKALLEHTHGKDLMQADLLVIMRGKALEFYSRHYGQVLTGDGQVLSVRDALLGINQLLDDMMADGTTTRKRPADNIEPASRFYLALFQDRDEIPRDELSKTLFSSGTSPNEFQAKGWIRVVGTKVYCKPIEERFAEFRVPGRTRKATLKTDLDQAHFLIGIGLGDSGLNISDELDNATYGLKRSVDAILNWYSQTSQDLMVREAAQRAARLLAAWRGKPAKTDAQLTLFSKLEAEAG